MSRSDNTMEIKEVAGVDKFDYSVLLLFFLTSPVSLNSLPVQMVLHLYYFRSVYFLDHKLLNCIIVRVGSM